MKNDNYGHQELMHLSLKGLTVQEITRLMDGLTSFYDESFNVLYLRIIKSRGRAREGGFPEPI